MKPFYLLITVAGLTITSAYSVGQFDHSHQEFTSILQKHVKNGRVDYSALKANPAALNTYISQLTAIPESEFKSWSKEKQLAFLINLYNAATLHVVIQHYPVKSIRDIGGGKGPWDQKLVSLFGKRISLNALEHEVIRPRYQEPRIHFALVCAAIGCPSLRSEAYTAEQLEQQLADQTKLFLADTTRNRIEGTTLWLSPIFDWYGSDFPGGVSEWVKPWLGSAKRVKFTEYDWSLNEQA